MINTIFSELIELILKDLSFDDILSFSITNKKYYNMLDNLFYLNLAFHIYGKEFWFNAYLRPKKISKPLGSIKLELIRIETFQKKIYKKCQKVLEILFC